MDTIAKQLLENLLDALDRLFDGESKAIDVYALVYATEKALSSTSSEVDLTLYEKELKKIAHTSASEEVQREEALIATNNLRVTLNELLPF